MWQQPCCLLVLRATNCPVPPAAAVTRTTCPDAIWPAFSRAIEAVNPDVSIATTSGSGLGTGRRCLAGTFNHKDAPKIIRATGLPTLIWFTESPTDATMPTASKPASNGRRAAVSLAPPLK
ncbi:Os09g0459850 [Oryza sativa Japonica Group]|uniref:Os09g0459850 protein n=1 Tax=Oryza sativa subsp. japonica TaxID=39947 RepID=A0A0P0XNX7_ORYSJ|nr:hypothetical protein EE612_048320 [Oryza sativa]BAT08468.1 Os09g0459850 [Oryza sativa Japonica Group]